MFSFPQYSLYFFSPSLPPFSLFRSSSLCQALSLLCVSVTGKCGGRESSKRRQIQHTKLTICRRLGRGIPRFTCFTFCLVGGMKCRGSVWVKERAFSVFVFVFGETCQQFLCPKIACEDFAAQTLFAIQHLDRVDFRTPSPLALLPPQVSNKRRSYAVDDYLGRQPC